MRLRFFFGGVEGGGGGGGGKVKGWKRGRKRLTKLYRFLLLKFYKALRSFESLETAWICLAECYVLPSGTSYAASTPGLQTPKP